MSAFVNREDVDFDSVDSITPDQTWELVHQVGKELPEYSTKISKFTNLRNVGSKRFDCSF